MRHLETFRRVDETFENVGGQVEFDIVFGG